MALINLRTKVRSQNIVTQAAGVRGAAKNILEVWQLYFLDSVIEEIVQCINKYIQKLRTHYTRERETADTNVIEVKAVLGLLYLSTFYALHI